MKTGKHTVTAISRSTSKSPLPPGIRVAQVDYDNEQSLVDALQGQQFLFISMALKASPDSQQKLITAAAKAGVLWIMPNSYGTDVMNRKLVEENFNGAGLWSGIKSVEEAGVSSWVMMCCQFWYEYSLSVGPVAWGFDLVNRKATFYDDGLTPINTSTWLQCGRAAAALVSLKILPEDRNDTSLTLSQWRNKPLYISSFLLSQRDMLDSIQRVTGTTDEDWQIDHESSQDRWARGVRGMAEQNHGALMTAMYARTHFPNGDGNLEKCGLANKSLGLPKEDLDKATLRGVEMSRSGYNAFARPQ